MLPTPAPSPSIDPCNHPPAIIRKAPLRGYTPTLQIRRPARTLGASDPFGAPSLNGNPAFNLSVTLDVQLDAKGLPTSVRVSEPSGDPGFDRVSADAAMRSTYDAAELKCVPSPGHYSFTETLGSIP